MIRRLLDPSKEGVDGPVKNHEDDHVRLQLDIKDEVGYTPLIWAAEHGFSAGAKHLIDAGADCNAQLETGATPLIAASSKRHGGIVSALLASQRSKEVEIDAKDHSGRTALHCAILGGHTKVVKLLLQAEPKADLEVQDNTKRSVLHFASLQSTEAILEMLWPAEIGPQLELYDAEHRTPLEVVIQAGQNYDVSKLPDDLGPDDLTDAERADPKFQPGRHGAVARLLLENGARQDITMEMGKGFLQLAAKSGDQKLMDLVANMMELVSKAFGPVEESRIGFDSLLTWTASDFERHHAAKLLVLRRYKTEAVALEKHKNWGPIEWAANQQLPKVLWLLIATSPRNEGTIASVNAVKKYHH